MVFKGSLQANSKSRVFWEQGLGIAFFLHASAS